ncbi:hypothetical protein [Geminocystis sp.]|uniref:hypothetical protein n=1 Tax=Geminocystis sp. TaxID=2664100 RepID=UPI0035943EB9
MFDNLKYIENKPIQNYRQFMGNIGKNTFKSLLFLIFSLSTLTSCQKTPEETLSCMTDLTQTSTQTDNNRSDLDISVNVDGSGSMEGYVTIPNNNYIKALQLLASAVIDTNNKTNLEYKRIGDDKILTRNNFVNNATSKNFYDGNDSNYKAVSSPIHSAIKPPVNGKDKLTIIVTDLEGDDGGKIAEVLAQNYLNKEQKNQDYTVGIWAVKSQFNGIIYNPNTGKAKFNYSTEGKTEEAFRPFYVLFIGKYEQIANYFDELKTLDKEIQNNSEMFIFPTQKVLVQNMINLGNLDERKSKSTLPENNSLERVFALEDNNVIVSVENPDNEPYELLSIVDNIEPKLTLNYQVAFPTVEKIKGGNYSLSMDENNLKTDTKVYTFSSDNQVTESTVEKSESDKETENKPQEETPEKIDNLPKNSSNKQFFTLNNNNSLQQGLVLKDLKLDKEKETLQFITDINLQSLPNSDVYLFEVNLILDDLIGLDWWNTWNANNQNNDGSKTQNLSIFMNKLKNLSLANLSNSENDPVIGNFCFAIQKN